MNAHHHVFGDLLPHHAHLLDADALSRLERRRRRRDRRARALPGGGCTPQRLAARDEFRDVLLGHAAGNAGARELRDVDAVFFRNLANEWRRTDATEIVERYGSCEGNRSCGYCRFCWGFGSYGFRSGWSCRTCRTRRSVNPQNPKPPQNLQYPQDLS